MSGSSQMKRLSGQRRSERQDEAPEVEVSKSLARNGQPKDRRPDPTQR